MTLGAPPQDPHSVGAYRGGEPRLARGAAPMLAVFDRQRLRMLAPFVSPGAEMLDVGAGKGRFVAFARAAGYAARGIEPSGRGDAADWVEHAGWEDAQVAPASLAAVSFWHVLEHLDDPGAAVARAVGWLRPGGVLLAGVPNLDSWQARWSGSAWYHLDVPRHRVHFTVRGLEALLSGAGLVPVRTHQVLLEHNPFGMWQSLVSRFTETPSWLYHALKRNARLWSRDAVVTAVALPLAPVAVGVEALAGLCGRGGTVAVVARRG